MSDINITIPLPVLAAGQYFKVRYRQIDPLSTWVDLAHQTNAPFTITTLDAGSYQLSAILVRSEDPLVQCEEVIQLFEVVEENLCGEFSFAIVANDDATLYYLQLTCGAMPVTPPCGGYDIVYGITSSTMATTHYANLGGTLLLPATNNTYHVEVHALNCDGSYNTCYNANVNPPEGGCDHATVTNAELVPDGAGWRVKLTITQSAPPTNPFLVAYSQGNLFNVHGGTNDSGSQSLAATPSTVYLTFAVKPRP